ncbi:hypothetical protein FA13DRAFT_1711572 [Coprinellus micaceus]|uniref:Uncharacterized protein n=1 Tax=Coprinellus micaceus TaxID=71717 RepID=A0A4Y7T3Z4_COPMI|nr:hypothetical protein FA13DRAFT_1711572 [Coprinellus micaceus]
MKSSDEGKGGNFKLNAPGPIKNANFPHRTLPTLPMNNAESVGPFPPNPFMMFFLPSSAPHTQRILDELHELLLGVHAWSLQDADGKEKRERLVDLTGRCMVGMMTYGGKDAFKRSDPVRAWVRLAASHPERLLKRGEMLQEQDLELINDISLLRALPVQMPEVSPGSTSTANDERRDHRWPTSRDDGAKAPFVAVTQMQVDEQADEDGLSRQIGPIHSIPSEENANQNGEPSEGPFPHHSNNIAQPVSGALKRKSLMPVPAADEETGEGRAKRARFEDRAGKHSQGEKGERRSGKTVEMKASIQNEGGREGGQGSRSVRSQDGEAPQENSVKPRPRKPATSRVKPQGLYTIPCGRCHGLGRHCQYIVIGRACYQCWRGKIRCEKAKGAIPEGEDGVTDDEEEVDGFGGIESKAGMAEDRDNRGESVEQIDVPPVPGFEKGELIPRAPSIVSEGAPLIPGTVAQIPDSPAAESQPMDMDTDQEEDATASTVNLRRSRRQQEDADKKRAEAERQRVEEEKARAEAERERINAERERARRHAEETERRDSILRAAAESPGAPLYNLEAKRITPGQPQLRSDNNSPISHPITTTYSPPPTKAQSDRPCSISSVAPGNPQRGVSPPMADDGPFHEPVETNISHPGQLPALSVPAGPTLHASSHVEARVQTIPNEATSPRGGVVAPEKHLDDVIEDLLSKMQSVREWTNNIDKLMEAQSQALMMFRNQTRNEGDQFPKAGMAPVPGSISPPKSVPVSRSAFAEELILSSPPPVSVFNAMTVSESPSTPVPQSSSSAQGIVSPFSPMLNSGSAPMPLASMFVDVPVTPTSMTLCTAKPGWTCRGHGYRKFSWGYRCTYEVPKSSTRPETDQWLFRSLPALNYHPPLDQVPRSNRSKREGTESEIGLASFDPAVQWERRVWASEHLKPRRKNKIIRCDSSLTPVDGVRGKTGEIVAVFCMRTDDNQAQAKHTGQSRSEVADVLIPCWGRARHIGAQGTPLNVWSRPMLTDVQVGVQNRVLLKGKTSRNKHIPGGGTTGVGKGLTRCLNELFEGSDPLKPEGMVTKEGIAGRRVPSAFNPLPGFNTRHANFQLKWF